MAPLWPDLFKGPVVTWWLHAMDTCSSLLAPCPGNLLVTDEFPAQWASSAELWWFLFFCLVIWVNNWMAIQLSYREILQSLERPRVLKLLYCFEIWQAHRQQCCWGAGHISELSYISKFKSCGMNTLWYITIRCVIRYCHSAQVQCHSLQAWHLASYIQCRCVITRSIFSKILTIDTL